MSPPPSVDAAAFQRFELEGWSRKAVAYDAFYEPLTTPLVEPLLEAAGVRPGSRVLDVGAGPGYVLEAAAAKGARPIGIDQARPMARLCRRRLGPVAYVLADAQRLPVASRSADAVVGNFVLHHLPDQERAIAEFSRVLRPNGRLALTVWDRPERCRFLGVFVDAVNAAQAAIPETLPPGPQMSSDEGGYRALLDTAGLHLDEVRSTIWEHDFGTPDRLWNGLLASSVRTAALVTEQDVTTVGRIRDCFDQLVAEYATDDGLVVPVAALLITGRR